jgi:hypothetical protein
MLSFRTGFEPEHKVTINPRHITHVRPQGPKAAWTRVYVVGGECFLVDDTYDDVRKMLEGWEERNHDQT